MPHLLILPGLDGTGTLHANFAAACAPAFSTVHTIAYPPDQCLGYEALTQLVRAQLPTNAPFVLLAESFSGPIGMAIAANAPANLQGLVLSTSFASSPLPTLQAFAGLLRFAPVRALPTSLIAPWLLGRWRNQALVAALDDALHRVQPQVLQCRAMAAIRAPHAAPRIRCPMLYLRAQQDRVIPRSAADQLLPHYPQLHIVDLDGPHLLLQTQPQQAADAVAHFARRL